MKLKPRYYTPKDDKPLLSDWPIYRDGRWVNPQAICKDKTCGRCIACASLEDNAVDEAREKGEL